MKVFKPLSLLLVFTLLLTACQSTDTQSENDDKAYNRIISLIPSNTETLYELGLGEKVVGVSTVDDYPKEVKNKKQFDALNLDSEALLKTKPDLVLAHESNKASQEKVLKQLEEAGVKVEYVKDATSIKEMYESFEQIGTITNKEKEADELVEEVKGEVNEVKKDIPKNQKNKKVFMEVSSQPDLYTSGSATFYDDMLSSIHAKNIFHNQTGWIKIDSESVISKNPDIMITTSGQSEEDYRALNKKRDGYDQINAVKENNLYAINTDKISRPGPRIAEGLKELADKIYQ